MLNIFFPAFTESSEIPIWQNWVQIKFATCEFWHITLSKMDVMYTCGKQYSHWLWCSQVSVIYRCCSSFWGVLDTALCNKVCLWFAAGQWFSPGTQVSSTNKTNCHNITEILLKVALSTITPLTPHYRLFIKNDGIKWFNENPTLMS